MVDNDQLNGVELASGTLIPRTAVFVRPRFVPNAELLTGLGCEVDEHGWVVRDPVGRAGVAGVWVAGNAADPRAQEAVGTDEASTEKQARSSNQESSAARDSWRLTVCMGMPAAANVVADPPQDRLTGAAGADANPPP